jgi:hypothetical protein
MAVISDEGKLFGRINIFDLLVLCLLAAAIALSFKWHTMAEDPSWISARSAHTKCLASLSLPDRGYAGGLPSYVAELVKAQDTAFDRDGQVVASIDQVVENRPAERAVYTSSSGDKLSFDSDDREVIVMLDLYSYEKNGSAYAAASGLPIRVGANIPLTTRRYSVTANICKLLQ